MHNITFSQNIIFYEDHFPFLDNTQTSIPTHTAPALGSFSGNHLDPIPETTPPHPMNQTLFDPDSSIHTSPPQLCRSTRTRQALTYLQDYHCDLTSLTANASSSSQNCHWLSLGI